MYIICATGHRPKSLYGYNLKDDRWADLHEKFKTLLVEKRCTTAISGMALGVDTVFAMAVIALRDIDKYPIKLHCAVPCYNLQEPWFNQADRDRFQEILETADEVTYVTKSDYIPGCLELRNRFMVDNSNEILAVWTGAPGGTAHCIDYAKKQGKKVTMLINEKGELYDKPKGFR